MSEMNDIILKIKESSRSSRFAFCAIVHNLGGNLPESAIARHIVRPVEFFQEISSTHPNLKSTGEEKLRLQE